MSFWRGFATAILAIELCALAYVFWVAAPEFSRMYAELGSVAHLPLVFGVVSSAAFRVGTFFGLVSVAVIADRLPRDPGRRAAGLGVAAALGAALLVFTMWSLYAPVFALAGRISAE